jgi:replicative DNA helicase
MTAKREPGVSSDQEIPRNPDAEQSVLGAILLDPGTIDAVMGILVEGDFCGGAHRQIYKTIIELWQRKVAIDLVTVGEELSRNGGLEKAGGTAYLSALIDGIPDIGNVEHYARIVKERAIRRRLIQLGEKLAADGRSVNKTAAAVVEEARNGLADLEVAAQANAEWVSGAEVLRDSPLRNAPRVKTGLARLDSATGGGLPIGSVLVLSGAPGSGKTTLGIQFSRAAREQLGAHVVGFFGDEGLEAAAVRLGQQIGLQREDLEAGVENSLTTLQTYTAAGDGEEPRGPFEFISPEEGLRATLAKIRQIRRAGEKRAIVLVLDNLQGCNFELEDRNGSGQPAPERLRLAAAMAELRKAARELAILVIVVSEASRGAYASKDPEKQTSALASGAETRAIEYRSDVVIHLSEKSEGVVRAEVAKNRPGGGQKPRLSLGHDRQRATYREIDTPAAEQERDEKKGRRRLAASEAAQKKLHAAMEKCLPRALKKHLPGVSKNKLAIESGLKRGGEAFEDGIHALTEGQGKWDGPLDGPRGGDYYRPAPELGSEV